MIFTFFQLFFFTYYEDIITPLQRRLFLRELDTKIPLKSRQSPSHTNETRQKLASVFSDNTFHKLYHSDGGVKEKRERSSSNPITHEKLKNDSSFTSSLTDSEEERDHNQAKQQKNRRKVGSSSENLRIQFTKSDGESSTSADSIPKFIPRRHSGIYSYFLYLSLIPFYYLFLRLITIRCK